MTPGEAMEIEMLRMLNGTWRTWTKGYPIHYITVIEGEAEFNRPSQKRRRQYQPISEVYRKKSKFKLVVNNSI